MSDQEMHFIILSNYDELIQFAQNLKVVKDNQKYLEFNLIVDAQEKVKKLKPLELNTLNLEANVEKLSENIDILIQNYHETVIFS